MHVLFKFVNFRLMNGITDLNSNLNLNFAMPYIDL